MQRLASFGLLAVALGVSASCSSKNDAPSSKGGGNGGASADASAATFTNVYQSVILAYDCIGPQCHGAGDAGGLRLDGKKVAYEALVGVPASGPCPDAGSTSTICGCGKTGKTRVVPGKPDESLLVEKLTGAPSCGDPMPEGSEPIPRALLDLVRQWIADGAPND